MVVQEALENAGALQRNVDAELFPRQLAGILDRGDFDLSGAAVDAVALNLDLAREAAVNGIEPQQMRIGLDRGEIVDGHDLHVLATGFGQGAQHVAANAAEPVDGDADGHFELPIRSMLGRRR